MGVSKKDLTAQRMQTAACSDALGRMAVQTSEARTASMSVLQCEQRARLTFGALGCQQHCHVGGRQT
jgi:hypothetical protein